MDIKFNRSKRLFLDDAYMDETFITSPALQPMLDALPKELQDIFIKRRFYFEKHSELLELLHHIKQGGKKLKELLCTVMIRRPRAAGKDQWQCGLAGCTYIDTKQHVGNHILKKNHLDLRMYTCRHRGWFVICLICSSVSNTSFSKFRFHTSQTRNRHEGKPHLIPPSNDSSSRSKKVARKGPAPPRRPRKERVSVNIPTQTRTRDTSAVYPSREEAPYRGSNYYDTTSEESGAHENILDPPEIQSYNTHSENNDILSDFNPVSYTEPSSSNSSELIATGALAVGKTIDGLFQHKAGVEGRICLVICIRYTYILLQIMV